MAKCLRCKGSIKKKTAKKYKGYSRYCLEMHEQELLPPTFKEVVSNLAKVNYEIGKNYSIKTIFNFLLEKKEFAYVYAVPDQLVDNYYDKYIVRLVNKITI